MNNLGSNKKQDSDWRNSMFMLSNPPQTGTWYSSPEMEGIFEIIAVDEDDKSIDIQYFDGEIEEIDSDTWDVIQAEEVAEPEDWSGAYIMSQEDLSEFENDTVLRPENWNNPTQDIDSMS